MDSRAKFEVHSFERLKTIDRAEIERLFASLVEQRFLEKVLEKNTRRVFKLILLEKHFQGLF